MNGATHIKIPCVDGELTGAPEYREKLVEISNVSKSFNKNDGSKLLVLRDFNFEVLDLRGKPQIMSILGPSGGGKSTFARILAGLDFPDTGNVKILKNGGLSNVKVGDVGLVYQSYPLFNDLSVLDNLVKPAKRYGVSSAKDKALYYLDLFRLSEFRDYWPMQLSGGGRQRVAILQQLILDRTIILLDEPFSGLDVLSINSLMSLIHKVAYEDEKNTFIIITHDVTSALTISDHVHLMGRRRDWEDKPIPGAMIIKSYDLIGEGLAYKKDLEFNPSFAELRRTIKFEDFPKL